MNDKEIDSIIDLNHPILLAFEYAEKKITWDEYLKKLQEWRDKKRD
jgi:hypothetical protein